MKTTALIVAAILSVSFNAAFADRLPPDAEALQAKRDNKVAEIDRIYVAELEKLQKKHMQDGALDAANRIAEEIKKIMPDPFVERFPKLEGKWLVNEKMVRSFYKNEMIDHVGGRHPWIYKNGRIVIDWGNGLETLEYDPKNPDVLDGENSNAEKVVYRKIP